MFELISDLYAVVVELADTIDLGSIADGVQVRVLSTAPRKNEFVYQDKVRSFFIFGGKTP